MRLCRGLGETPTSSKSRNGQTYRKRKGRTIGHNHGYLHSNFKPDTETNVPPIFHNLDPDSPAGRDDDHGRESECERSMQEKDDGGLGWGR